MTSSGSLPSGIWTFRSFQMCVRCSLHASCSPLKNKIRAAQQQHFRGRRVPARQRGQILVDDGLEQGSDDFVDGHARLEQGVGVRFRENSALAADLMERVPRVMHFGELFRT